MMLHARATRRFLSAAALVAGGVLIAGCGSSSNGSTRQSGSASSHETVSFSRAADLSADAAGYRMNMTMVETAAGQTVNANANGSFNPKAHQGSVTMDMGLPAALGGEQRFQMVMSDGVVYVKFPAALASKLPGAKPWLSINLDELGKAANMPGLGSLVDSSSTLNDPGECLDFLRATAAGSVTDVGQETIAGVQTTHYQADVEFSKLPDALPSADRQSVQQLIGELQSKASVPDFPVDVWIDGSDLVRRMMLNMKETVQGHAVDVQVTENFSDYGTQPAPTIPSADQTTDLMTLISSGG